VSETGILLFVLLFLLLIIANITCQIYVATKVFKGPQVIRGIVRGTRTFIYGWKQANELGIKDVMIFWSILIILLTFIVCFAGAIFFTKGSPLSSPNNKNVIQEVVPTVPSPNSSTPSDSTVVDDKLSPNQRLENCKPNCAGVKLSFINLDRADLSGINLSGANLHAASLRWVQFNGTDLSGANLDLAILSGSDLSGAKLNGTNLKQARYTKDTKWPDSFNPGDAGAILLSFTK